MTDPHEDRPRWFLSWYVPLEPGAGRLYGHGSGWMSVWRRSRASIENAINREAVDAAENSLDERLTFYGRPPSDMLLVNIETGERLRIDIARRIANRLPAARQAKKQREAQRARVRRKELLRDQRSITARLAALGGEE